MTEIYNREKGLTLSAEKSNSLTTFKIFRDVIIRDNLKKRLDITGQVDAKGLIDFKVNVPLNSSSYFDGFCSDMQWVSSELKKIVEALDAMTPTP